MKTMTAREFIRKFEALELGEYELVRYKKPWRRVWLLDAAAAPALPAAGLAGPAAGLAGSLDATAPAAGSLGKATVETYLMPTEGEPEPVELGGPYWEMTKREWKKLDNESRKRWLTKHGLRFGDEAALADWLGGMPE